MRWVRLPLGEEEFAREVAALRCGLDDSLWNNADSYDTCVETVKKYRYDANFDGQFVRILPFDLERAHGLYKTLLGPVEDVIKDKQLLVVPSGALISLPFSVLVTEPPKARIPDSADRVPRGELARCTPTPHDIAVCRVAEIAAPVREAGSREQEVSRHRQSLARWTATRGVEGLLQRQAEAARSKNCLSPSRPVEIASFPQRRSVGKFEELFRGTGVDIEQVRQQTPLPGTADELCEIGRRLGVPVSDIILGPNATEGALKDLSDKGSLADYAIVHFATHGALTGQLTGWSEPGLILTPPPKAPPILSFSSATTAMLPPRRLPRSSSMPIGSFFRPAIREAAAARAPRPCPGWRVHSSTQARGRCWSRIGMWTPMPLSSSPRAHSTSSHPTRMGRAEAFRASMRELIENGKAYEAHPSEWGPFVVVGEGAAGR